MSRGPGTLLTGSYAKNQNLFTEWHSRYGGRGILVYWHVERGSVVVHSQTLKASAPGPRPAAGRL
ncbi:Tn3 family transposase [Spongiactinospora sp. TRM90649]|nr:Tn3 family transposase [Spongiactinospora sp. TRM90649]MDF5757333.1 Tn3 family transposase [Spongiactinospora sp. TRM90649]